MGGAIISGAVSVSTSKAGTIGQLRVYPSAQLCERAIISRERIGTIFHEINNFAILKGFQLNRTNKVQY